MCRIEQSRVSNIKFHFRLSSQERRKVVSFINQHQDSIVKPIKNFVVTRLPPSYTFTIFPKHGHVNVTGVENFSHVTSGLCAFNSLFSCQVEEERVKIDNSTSSARLVTCFGPLNLSQICGFSSPLRDFHISFRPHFFPGVVFRHRRGHRTKGTNILFASGKFVTVGSKCLFDIQNSQQQLCANIHQIVKFSTSTLET